MDAPVDGTELGRLRTDAAGVELCGELHAALASAQLHHALREQPQHGGVRAHAAPLPRPGVRRATLVVLPDPTAQLWLVDAGRCGW